MHTQTGFDWEWKSRREVEMVRSNIKALDFKKIHAQHYCKKTSVKKLLHLDFFLVLDKRLGSQLDEYDCFQSESVLRG